MDLVPSETDIPSRSIVAFPERKIISNVAVSEVYLDGKLKKAELTGEDQKSFGIFMHSLILSNYAEVMKVDNDVDIIGDDYEKAIFHYTASKGFDKKLIDSIAPRVTEFTFEYENNLKVSTHLINEKMRIISKGTPDLLLKRCTYVLQDSRFVKVTRKVFREVNDVMKGMLQRCISVYAIAIKDISKISEVLSTDAYVNEMTLVALVGMSRA